MKKHLLATTAIAAATGLVALSGPADAAEKLKLGIGGYFQAYVGYFDADEDFGAASRRDFDFFREAEVHFNGEVALDNGMKVGVDVQLEAETCADQIDESYLYFQGDFGKLILGSENSAAYLMSYGAPAADSNFDGADPNYQIFDVNTPLFQYAPAMTGDSEKITYMTPRFAGFAAGASWTPDNTEDGGAGSTIPAVNNNAGEQEDIFEFGINYENKFGDFGILAGVTYGFATDVEADPRGILDERQQFTAGLNVTFGAFTVGGGYFWDNQGLDGDNGRTIWAFGGAWANGPLRIGASWATVDNNDFTGAGGPPAANVDRYALGASYVYGPGMQLRGSVLYWDTDNAPAYEDALAVVVGTVITF